MEFNPYIRKPFRVMAVQVTVENLPELSEMVGDGKIRHKDDGSPYFQTDWRIIRQITKVEPGYWVTKMDNHFRAYKPDAFEELFSTETPLLQQLVELMLVAEEQTSEGGDVIRRRAVS